MNFDCDCLEEPIEPDDYRQCLLSHADRRQVSWIPAKFAVVGKLIVLKKNGKWTGGWLVEEVFGSLKAETAVQRSRDYKRQRKASDLPRGTLKK